MKNLKVSIIGGGIGGLTAGVSLLKKGFDVEIYEAAPSYAHVGGGHWLYGNALQTLDKLNPEIAREFQSKGQEFDGFLFTDNKKNKILYQATKPFTERTGFAPIVMHRADIINILASHIPIERIHFGKKLLDYKNNVLEFEDGSKIISEIVIGADGIHSKIRNEIAPDVFPNDRGQVGFWGISKQELPADMRRLFMELWGNGKRAGFTYVGTGEVYWFMVVKKESVPTEKYDIKDFIIKNCGEFPAEIKNIIENTNAGGIHYNPLMDLPLISKWYNDNACCIGDAVHASTPNLGQGGCQAIEDGYWIGEMMAKYNDPSEVFCAFQKKRFRRASTVVLLSRWLGNLAQSEGKMSGWFRNNTVRYHPRFLVNPLLYKIMTLDEKHFSIKN